MFSTYGNGKDYILLLKADEFLRDRAIAAAARCYEGMVCGMALNPAHNRVRIFDEILRGDPHNPESALAAVKEFEIRTGLRPRAVIPITEMTLMSARLIARDYRLPFLSDRSVEAGRNKLLMKEAFFSHGVPTPKFIPFGTLAELEAAAEILQFPLIVKPSEAAHSVGVKRLDSAAELAEGYAFCTAGLRSISSAWGISEGSFQAEQYIDAKQELSVELVNCGDEHKIIAITDKFLTEPPYFAEIGHRVPSVESDNDRIRAAAKLACAALGLNYGVSHVEIRIDAEGRPFVIEVAARPGGDGIMDLVERAYGINMYEAHVKSYLNVLDIRALNPRFKGTAAIAFMPAEHGRIRKIARPEQLPREVTSLYLNAREGDVIGGSMNYDDRLGTVEFFWPEISMSDAKHLSLARQLRDDIFDIEPV